MKRRKILWAYSAANDFTLKWHERLIKERVEAGYDVKPFCLTPKYLNNGNWIPYDELNRLWKIGYEPLLKMYRELFIALEDRDVLIHYNGANIHEDIVKRIPQYKVYTCGDDPESTEKLSKPVAKFYDVCLVNNYAVLDMYRSWGIDKVFFQPLGSIVFPEDIVLTADEILNISKRTTELVYIGEYNTFKKDMFDSIIAKYPFAKCYGSGWPAGRISDDEKNQLYYKSQIGFNIHNSSGPINFRLYDLPAYGIMQICDNKTYLDSIFKINEEVVGFDTFDECIDNIDYYLSHTKEQREIALNGWTRWKNDYTPMKVWEKMIKIVDENYYARTNGISMNQIEKFINDQRKKHKLYKALYMWRR